ncbi:MAG: 50S ribosomal protein L24 [Candidatus Pacebacteria bacterium]|nr:50S ribosomal protein L24 [Candidatus Paceibacterota bacterium]
MKIKKGDNIIVISGKDKGKTAPVLKAFPALNRVVVEGVNVRKIHERARKGGQKGQIVDRALPINVSNVMIVDPKTHKRTRVGKERRGDKTIRIAKKSGAALDK